LSKLLAYQKSRRFFIADLTCGGQGAEQGALAGSGTAGDDEALSGVAGVCVANMGVASVGVANRGKVGWPQRHR
jgi:hypothetical protein